MSDSKKTRSLPNQSDCGSCSRHIPNPNKNNYNQALITLQSYWRVVLLCTTCFNLIKQTLICSYCYKPATTQDSHKCPNCNCLVHKNCVIESSNSPPWSYCHKKRNDFRVCLDCWLPKGLEMEYRRNMGISCVKYSNLGTASVNTPLVVSNNGRRSKKKIVAPKSPALSKKVCENGKELKSCLEGEARVSSDGEKKFFLTPRAKGKGIVVKGIPEVVKRALEYANGTTKVAQKKGEIEKNKYLVGCTTNDSGLDDAELAFKLHRAMNSSPRISRRVALGSSLEPSVRYNFTYKRRGNASRLNNDVETNGACLEPFVNMTSFEEGGLKHELLVYTRKCNKCNATTVRQVEGEALHENYNIVSENQPSQGLLVYKRKCKKCDENQAKEVLSEDGMIFGNQFMQDLLVYQRKCKTIVENQGIEVVPENGIVPVTDTHHSQDLLVYKRKYKKDVGQENGETVCEYSIDSENEMLGQENGETVREYSIDSENEMLGQENGEGVREYSIGTENEPRAQENGEAVRECSIDTENEKLFGSDRYIFKYKKRAVTLKKCTNGGDMNMCDGPCAEKVNETMGLPQKSVIICLDD